MALRTDGGTRQLDADDSADYLRRTLTGVLRAGVRRVSIGEQAGCVLMRVRFSSDAPTASHVAAVVRELEGAPAASAGRTHVRTTRQTTSIGEQFTVVRSRAGRLFAFVVSGSADGEVIVTAVPIDDPEAAV